jgi:iron complex outermembrane receptor protein
MNIEDLTQGQETSMSKKAQSLSQTAAGVYVISQDDIQRSGATSIPDLPRLMPGRNVAQTNSNIWAVSARVSTKGSPTNCR